MSSPSRPDEVSASPPATSAPERAATRVQAAAQALSAHEDDAIEPTGARSRIAWCVTGSGHFLDESLAIARTLPHVDLFLSSAGEEVLQIYGMDFSQWKAPQGAFGRIVRDKTASGVPVGMLYDDQYHTVVVAPATSNTVAKCAFGISDSLPTNMVAQAGKLGIPSIVFACDTEPVVVTRAPHDWVTLRPRNVEFANVDRLETIDHVIVARSIAELQAALDARMAAVQSGQPGAAVVPVTAAAD